MRTTRRSLLLGAGATLLLPRAAAAEAETAVIEGPAFGASWRVVLPAGADRDAAGAALRAIVKDVDAAMSPFRAGSEVGRFNAGDDTGWVAVPAPVRAVVAEALRVARLTGGAFDPTVGPLVGRWGFGPITRVAEGDHRDIEISPAGLRKADAALSLDLCGIAKGHALDRMAAALDGLDVPDWLVELGGEVRGRGRHPSGRAWHVGIERPLPGDFAFQCVVDPGGLALATSGDRVNGFDIGGRRHAHIIDPARRRPATGALASVSVLAPRGDTADALATALFALGAEAGPDFAALEAIPALFLLREGGGIRELATGGFDARIVA